MAKVDSKHELYDKLRPKWDKTRIIDGGEDSVHEAGTLLLPMLEQQDEVMYQRYKVRTRFLPAFSRTIQGLAGTVTRKDPVFNIDRIEEYTDNIDSSGTSLNEYYKLILDEMLKVGVCGTLVDYVPVLDPLTVAEAETSNMRPNLAFYKAENIINWKYDTVNNVHVLTMVVLHETVSRFKDDDEFDTETYDQYRVLRLDPEGHKYTQQLYVEEDNGHIQEGEVITPTLNGEPIEHIPFYIHGWFNTPPLYDLVTTNIKHYQLKADHNHALHYIGLPTPIFPGVDPSDPNKPQTIGPEQIVYLSDYRSKPYYLTYGGDGLDSIEKELTALKEDMAYLGANMLAPESHVSETATKATIRRASETSALSLIAENESTTLTKALQFFAEWAGVPKETAMEDVGIELSTDFDPVKLGGQELLALVTSWQNGAFSKETLFWNLQQGEIIHGEVSFEDEEERIQNEVPAAGFGPEGGDENDEDEDDNDDNIGDEGEAEKEADDEKKKKKGTGKAGETNK